MAFDVSIYSADGLKLVSELTTSKTLRIKRIFVDEAQHPAIDIEQPVSWWDVETILTMEKVNATLIAASSIPREGDANQSRYVIGIDLKQGQTDDIRVKTIVVTACGVEGGVEGAEVVLFGVSDDEGLQILKNVSGIPIMTCVSIDSSFQNADSDFSFPTGTNPDFAMQSDLDRFVSCHRLGDTASGEYQEVQGTKRFLDSVFVSMEGWQKSFGVEHIDPNGGSLRVIYSSSGITIDQNQSTGSTEYTPLMWGINGKTLISLSVDPQSLTTLNVNATSVKFGLSISAFSAKFSTLSSGLMACSADLDDGAILGLLSSPGAISFTITPKGKLMEGYKIGLSDSRESLKITRVRPGSDDVKEYITIGENPVFDVLIHGNVFMQRELTCESYIAARYFADKHDIGDLLRPPGVGANPVGSIVAVYESIATIKPDAHEVFVGDRVNISASSVRVACWNGSTQTFERSDVFVEEGTYILLNGASDFAEVPLSSVFLLLQRIW